MAADDRREIARQMYLAFAAGDRSFFEQRLSDQFTFSSPPDPSLRQTTSQTAGQSHVTGAG